MTATYWIKLYYEILGDKKMARMDDHLWRRTVELFLLAGENEKQGELPSMKDICWSLRSESGLLHVDLDELKDLGIVSEKDGVWTVVNFAKRQAPSANAKRQKKYRDNHKSSVTNNVTDNACSGALLYASASASVNLTKVLKKYESEIGMPTQRIYSDLASAEQEYPDGWIEAAIDEASRNNKRSWSYCDAILRRWKVEGFQSKANFKNAKGVLAEPERYTEIE
jgi:DnaD/phage-associated family protein